MAIRELISLRNPPKHELPRDNLASDVDDRIWVGERPEDAQPIPHAWRMRTMQSWLDWIRKPGSEIGIVIAGWPLWWAVGFTPFIFPVLGFVLAWKMRGRRLAIPRGFWIWLFFLCLVLISGIAINVDTPGTVHSTGIGRYIALMIRFMNYAAITLVMLYVGNATERDLPRKRVIAWMTALCVWTVGLGTLSIVAPNAGFKTLLSYALPSSLLGGGDGGVAKLAQVQPVLGETSPRPSAPFAFTNAWGNNLSLLLIWAVVMAIVATNKRTRVLIWTMLGISMIPLVYSLNRGVWIGMIISFVLVGIRLAVRGRMAVVGTIGAGLLVAGILFAFSPLQTMVTERAETGHSNDIRKSLGDAAVAQAWNSPFIGFGSTRQTIGSDASIVIGPSSSCATCGYRDIGSTGQLWLLLISQGWLGVILYFGFLARCIWNYRADCSPIGIAGTLVIGLAFFYSLFYNSLAMPFAITFLSIALLWRNQTTRLANAEKLHPGARV